MTSLKQRIQDGIDGKYTGLNNGLGDINKYIHYIQRGVITLVGGMSGASKTFLTDFILFNAIAAAKKEGVRLVIFYYSFEIKEETKKLNWLSVHIYQKYGVTISPETIGGFGGARMTSDERTMVDAEVDYVDELFASIHFRYEPINPTGVFHELMEYAEANGKVIKEKYILQGEERERITGYISDNPSEYVLGVMDHIALAKRERNYNLKENIDKQSEYLVFLRNIFNYSFFIVQQFNQGLGSVDRMKYKGVDLSPQQSDFKDSNNTYADADVVLGVMNPWKMDFKEYLGYDLRELKEKVRVVKVIKNRLGRDNVAFAYLFNGAAGSFRCLPPARDIELFGGYEQFLI